MKTTAKQKVSISSRHLKPLLALALVATVAIVLFVANKTSTPTYNTTTPQTQQPTTQLPPTQPDPKQPVEDPSYLVIKEWGVRFKLPPELQGDVYYVLNEKGVAKFGSYSLEKIEPECSALATGVGPVLTRIKQGDEVPDYLPKSFRTIGAFDYRLAGKGAGCNQNGKLDASRTYIVAESSIGEGILSTLESLV